MSKPLHLKYRPQKLKLLFGNKSLKDQISSILEKDPESMPHSYLLHGPSGCGKTTIARILANEFNVSPRDLQEINASSTRGIDAVRTIIDECRFPTLTGGNKMYILDEAHMLTREAQNALLKILEDTPPHVFFVICTTDPQKLLQTIRNRCTSFQVNPLTTRDMLKLLKYVCRKEGKEVDKNIQRKIINAAMGSPRQALVILDSVIDINDPRKIEEVIHSIESKENSVIELCRELLKGSSWKRISKIYKGIEEEPETIRRTVLAYADKVLISSGDPRAAVIIEALEDCNTFNSGKAALTKAFFELTLD